MDTVVVIGGGIVGLSAAYYLTAQGKAVTLVEKCDVACHSSGKGGGFLTDGDSGWHQGAIAKLAKHSFSLHEQIANDLGVDAVGYRRVKCVGRGPPGAQGLRSPAWLEKGQYERDMGNETGLAQITPYKFMAAMLERVKAKGCTVLLGKVVGIEMSEGRVSSVKVEKEGKCTTLSCSAALFAMGPWTQEVAAWFPDSPLPKSTVSNRYTSVIWDDTEVGKDATMVFTMSEEGQTELYPRVNECYANGCPTSPTLPDDPLSILPPQEEIDIVKKESIAAVGRLKDAPVLRATACFLAGSDDGRPVVGPIPKTENAFIACGGGCWGLLNGPAMGHAAAALILGQTPAVDLKPFGPARFDRAAAAAALSGLPAKLRALVAENPQLGEMLAKNPEAASQLLAMMQAQDGDDE
eukprot:TRINITY_DN48066_c0_g1_i1.p1 TRINITY_DN48066_c0_g1~~TRINITY_DN48066_c0_g1_i1.p1  ORF type:complete len:408 (+),score=53.20 TRINITY_DN48066_c0_g1_i1:98-1321(+)